MWRFKRFSLKKIREDKRLMSGIYAVSLVTALLILALVIRGPEESGKLISDSEGNITGISRKNLGRSESYQLGLEVGEGSSAQRRDVTLTLQAGSGSSLRRGISGSDDREAQLDAAIDSMISEIEYSRKRKISLPASLADGTPLRWTAAERGTSPLMALIPALYAGLVLLMVVSAMREDRSVNEERKAIMRGLPRFCNQLFLMMNAGLILSDAFDTITGTYTERSGSGLSPFERDLAVLREETLGHRVSTSQVIEEYAVRRDVKELIRIAAILTENEKRGSDVIESLARESRYLWDERKITAREYGKSIDTKMSYPLGLLLILLIVITMAPAMLNI